MNQKTKMRYTSQKGITLIALVITIIVLLILAGVTISMVLGDDGIISQAQQAKNAQESGARKDEGAISQAEGVLSRYNMEKYTGGIAKQNSTQNGEKASSSNPVIPKGFKAVEKTAGVYYTVDEGFIIEDSEENQFVWVPVEDTENFATLTNFKTDDYPNTGEPGTEPAVAAGNYPWGGDGNDNSELNRKAILDEGYENTVDGLLKQFTDEYNAMVKSVTTYGGFYVGRYETGWDESNGIVVSKPGVPITDVKDLSSVGWKCGNIDYSNWGLKEGTKATWYGLYAKQKELYKKNSSSSVVSGMIYGCQWDAIMNWMSDEENANVSGAKFIYDSTEMGWFSENQSNNAQRLTGLDFDGVTNKVKNIYDLAGLYSEATQEGDGDFGRVARGLSNAGTYTWDSPVTRYGLLVDGENNVSSRLQLYIK